MKTRTEVLEILRSLKAELRERYHVERIALFGSYAREEQEEGSDIDVLVEFGSGADLFDFVGLSQYLEEKLGSGVDVVPEAALRPEIRRSVTRDLLVA
ncbi:nucleotidyltransferase family protein [Methanoculleus oceani]|uniref:protein adenylyltransferase n=1 Tax=Methanoculleus oceani TaxID=2184756 RepID=A0ABD4TEX7_9EURY|nr:nucleotidyltransferase family protein [Methanoculleus sp. CWC-02]MCM2466910.1 nucleotidyltransferase [Methanoculleus sp. CWC-02]